MGERPIYTLGSSPPPKACCCRLKVETEFIVDGKFQLVFLFLLCQSPKRPVSPLASALQKQKSDEALTEEEEYALKVFFLYFAQYFLNYR